MRRSAVSIPSNIAEGSQRVSNKEFANFILIAKGSLAELQTQIRIAHNLSYISTVQLQDLLSNAEQISKMMFSFHASLKTDD
jgi:four helix bundle protein